MDVVSAVRATGDFAEVLLYGDLDDVAAPALNAKLAELIDRGHTRLVIDVSDLRRIDASGVVPIVTAFRSTLEMGGTLVIQGAHGPVAEMLATTGVDRLITVVPMPGDGDVLA